VASGLIQACTAAKAGLIQITQTLAAGQHSGIRVNVVSPGSKN